MPPPDPHEKTLRATAAPQRGTGPRRCTATTKAGERCRNRPTAGQEVCQPHSGGQVGRPSKLTEEVQREILEAVRAGSYLAPAARRAGISEKTVYEWLREGRKQGAPPRLAAFVVAFERAEAEAEIHCVGIIRQAIARGDARLALEVLSRRHAERWGKNRAPVGEEAQEETAEPALDLSLLSDADYETLKELQRRASGA